MSILLLVWRVLDHAVIVVNVSCYDVCLSEMRNEGTGVLDTLFVDPY